MKVCVLARVLLTAAFLLSLLTLLATAQDWLAAEQPKVPDQAAGPGCSPQGIGGPDSFGYTYRDSAQPDGPAYNWIDISATGTFFPFDYDSTHGPYPIGFVFNFYGTDYSELWVSSEGWLSILLPLADYSNDCPLPNPNGQEGLIAAFWDDRGPSSGPYGSGYHQSFVAGTCPYPAYEGACMVVEWLDVPLWGNAADTQTFEVILFDNHYILVQIQDAGLEQGTSATTGLENTDASIGLIYGCNTAGYLQDGRAVMFYYPGPNLAASRKTATAAVELGERIDYTVEIVNTGNQVAANTVLTDVLPQGTTFISGSLACSTGTCWYDDADGAVYWNGGVARASTAGTRPTLGTLLTNTAVRGETQVPVTDASAVPHQIIPAAAPPGTVLETFDNVWDIGAEGLVYDPSRGLARYAHEVFNIAGIWDVDYAPPHPDLDSMLLSALNPGWPDGLDKRNGVAYDPTSDAYLMPDYQGDLSNADDNIAEIAADGTILNAWEMDDGVGSNDSYDGSTINEIVDIAVVPGTPTRYFVTALGDGNNVYEIDLIKTGSWWTADTWGKVMTCTVPGLADNVGIDYDNEHGLLYHSDWSSTAIVVTDLACNVVNSFTCASPNNRNTGVTYIEGQSPPEIWVTDDGSNQTTRCAASAPPACDRPVSLFADDFEEGLGDWTLTGLWNEEHEDDTCGALVAPFPSPDTGVYFGQEGICTYNTGARVTGTLVLDLDVDLSGYGHAALNFSSYEKTECGGYCRWDNRYVDVSTDGGETWATVWVSTGPEEEWYQASVSLWAYGGGPLRVRFRFDSGDNEENGFLGWLVDDVELVACPRPIQLSFAVEAPAWCGPIVNEAVVTDPEAGAVTLQATTYVVEELYQLWAFEIDGGGFDRDLPGEWEWGTPTYPLGITAHSGRYVWGTDLHGDADDTVGHHRLSRPVTLPTHPNGIFVSWWDWNGAEASDCTNVYVDGTLVYGHCDRDQRQWTHHLANLSAWAGQTVDLEFDLEVCCTDPGPDGWYIDDVAVQSGCIPDIEVAGPPLEVSLCTDEVRTLDLSISNHDNLPLVWHLKELTAVTALGQDASTLDADNGPPPAAAGLQSDRAGVSPEDAGTEPEIQAVPRSVAPKAPTFVGRVLWDDTHDDDGDDLMVNYLDLYNALTLAGYDVVQLEGGPIDGATLALYDILVIVDAEIALSPAEIAAIQNWVDGGHGLLAISDWQTACDVGTYDALLAPYGIQHTVDSVDSDMTDISAHALTQGVTQITGNGWGGLAVTTPGVDLIRDSTGLPVLAANPDYQVVDVTDSNLMDNTYYASSDNALLMDNIFAWLLEAGVDVPWLSQAPISETVLLGECVTVEVTFDAAGLPIDDYAAELVVWSNDPDTPAIHLPVAMHVTCAMRIYLPLIVRNYP
jgi:uncharacterized repeat protein (TIGR01451 family)